MQKKVQPNGHNKELDALKEVRTTTNHVVGPEEAKNKKKQN
jgi:hypothetical protein